MTTNINPKFMIQSSLQELFRDKDTGLPLRSGYVEFFKDQDRVTYKNIYKLSGSPGVYSYVALPNRVPLTGIGTTSDAGSPANDIVWYYYPYDSNGDIELYYARIYNSAGVFQFDRQAWPNFVGGGSVAEDIINYIPNGQFEYHNNIPADVLNGLVFGEISQSITDIAPGGWTFERPESSGATDIVTFQDVGSFTTNPTASPRFVFNLETQVTSPGDFYKDLRLKFSDVNKFASDDQEYTFGFEGQSNSGSSAVVTLVLIKNFGTGGSATTETIIQQFTLTDTFSLYQTSFVFGDNSGKTIGDLNDDYVQLAIRFKTNVLQNISLVNFIDTPDMVTLIEFPQTTNKDFASRSFALDELIYDGSDIGLPIIKTLSGFDVDYSVVGNIHASVNATEEYSFLCDGTQYLTSGYQPNGVPNSRLQEVLYAIPTNSGGPAFGTGQNFLTSAINVTPNELEIHTNTAGIASPISDGSIPTGFDFSRVHVGSASYGVTSFWTFMSPSFTIWNNSFGVVTAVGAGTSGFTVSNIIRTGSTLTSQITLVTPNSVSSIGGKYFTFDTITTAYYVWYQVDNVGTDPSISGRTGILVNIRSTNDVQYLAEKTSNSLNGYETSSIIFTNGSSITAGSFFNMYGFGGTITNYYVWYQVDSVGTDPAPVGGTGILVNVGSSSSALDVLSATYAAINSFYFAVPDLRGQYIIGNDPTHIYDIATRFSFFSDDLVSGVGSYQLDSNLSHDHNSSVPVFVNTAPGGGSAAVATGFTTLPTSFSGGTSSNPYNVSLNYFIKY